MTVEIIRSPQIDVNSEFIKIVSVQVQENDFVEENREIASLETLKSVTHLESPRKGYIRKILVQEGDEVKVNWPLFILTDDLNESIAEALTQIAAKDGQPANQDHHVTEEMVVTAKARQIAEQSNIDLGKIVPSDGKVIRKEDVLKYLASQEGSQEERKVGRAVLNDKKDSGQELSEFEKGTILTLKYAKEKTVPAYLERILDLSPLFQKAKDLREKESLIFDPLFPLLSWAFVQCVVKNRKLNSYYSGKNFVISNEINLGFTMDVKGDLYVVTLENVEQYGQTEFIKAFFAIQRKAMKKQLSPKELSGATIAITSLASFGITRHQPILPPNTSVILAHSDVLPYSPEGKKLTTIGVSYDHQVHSGTHMAKMLENLNHIIKNMNERPL